jgi:Domain of unknown function (DUF4864)
MQSRPVRALFLALGLLVAGPGSLAAQDALSPEDRSAIRAVITSQLDAFRRDDAASAFSFAAPSIQKQFGTAGEFMKMVRAGYAPVYRQRSVRFLDAFVVAGQPVQPVELVTVDDAVVVAFYMMEHQADGSWKISGCALEESANVSA